MLTADLNQNRRLGCEFEFVLPQLSSADSSDVRRVFAEILSANGLTAVARGYSHAPVPHGVDWAVEYDGSVAGPSDIRGLKWVALEIKTRILTGMDDWERVVPRALAIARYLGGRVHASCGHHVHVELAEVRHEPDIIRSLVNVVQRYEQLILGLVAPSRRANQYAQKLPTKTGIASGCRTLDQYRQTLGSLPRQSGVNLTHLWESDSPRIEYRWHQGTLEEQKARHWALFLLRLTDHAAIRTCKTATEQLANDRTNLNRMLTTIGLKVNSRVYAKVALELRETGRFLLRRWKAFNSNTPPSNSPTSEGDN